MISNPPEQDLPVTYSSPRQTVHKPVIAVLLPGTGSDERFVTQVFAGPLAAAGWRLLAPRPAAGCELANHHLAALDSAAEHGPIMVGGISFGAHLAAEWAARNPARCAGLLLALPAWHGPSDGAPAAMLARASADAVETLGTAGALAAAASGPPWLAEELHRAWQRHGAGLAASLRVAAAHPAPSLAQLRRITVPAGIAAFTDDPVHPTVAAQAWCAALPRAALRTTSLAALGADRESLGRATVAAWRSAADTAAAEA